MTGGARLAGRVAIVTGATGGIGSATCAALAEQGAAVVAVDLARPAAAALAESLLPLGAAGALGLDADVRSHEAMEAMAGRALERFGRIDILVAAAGILRGRGRTPRPLAQIGVDEWDDVIGTNLRGTFLANRAVLPAMIRQRSGHIVNISSTSGRKGRAFDSVYCASKFGVVGLTESVALEVQPFGIKVDVVLPDAVETPLWEQNGPIRCPPGSLAPRRIADLIVQMLCLPPDTQLVAPTIVPFRSGARGHGGRPPAAE